MNENNSTDNASAVVGDSTEAAILEWRLKLITGAINTPWPLTPPSWVREVEVFIDQKDSALIEYRGRPHQAGQYTARVRRAFMVDLDSDPSVARADAFSVFPLGVEIDLPKDPNLALGDAVDYSRSISNAALELAGIRN